MAIADEGLWRLASGPERARWAAQAVERYLHMARIIMTRAAAWPAPEAPFPPHALDLARQLQATIARRVDELGRPPRPDVLCAHCGARPFFPYPVVPDEEAWPAGAAAAALGPVGSLYAAQDANKSKEQQSLFQLAALLGNHGAGDHRRLRVCAVSARTAPRPADSCAPTTRLGD